MPLLMRTALLSPDCFKELVYRAPLLYVLGWSKQPFIRVRVFRARQPYVLTHHGEDLQKYLPENRRD